MTIPFVEKWNQHKIAQKLYPLSLKDRKFLDKIYNTLHKQGRIEWVTKPIAFTTSIFVI